LSSATVLKKGDLAPGDLILFGIRSDPTENMKWHDTGMQNRIDWHYIAPGKPMQNGFIVSPASEEV
jgi:hypothetical protein